MPVIILDHPQMGENIGAAARAMMNFGLENLRLVAPRDGWPNEKAEAMSSGALEAIAPVDVFETLPTAISDLQFVLAATARPRDMVKPVFTPEAAAKEMRRRHGQGQKIGLLFGAERTGLLNDDIALAHGIITIPTSPQFPALNLAQSVLLLAYEWMKSGESVVDSATLRTGESEIAPHSDLEHFLKRLEDELEKSGQFFRSENLAPTMKRNIRNIFMRGDLTVQEVRTLQGILTALSGK